jgi:hypothetical protein
MAIVVEDGTGKPDANSYASVATADAYHADRGNTAWLAEQAAKETALVRATQYIESRYRGRWPGTRLKLRDQRLEWPRYGAFVNYGPDYVADSYVRDNSLAVDKWPIGTNEVPQELIDATCEAALRELAKPGQLQPDVTIGLKRDWAGDTGQEFFLGAGQPPKLTVIDGILGPILITGTGNGMFGVAERF